MPVINHTYYTKSDGEFKQFSIVLIHGAGSNRLSWPATMRRIKGYQVLAIDLPGHGNSKDVTGFHTIKEYSQRVVELLIKAEVYQAVIVGHSMGGAIAMNIALEYPQLVTGLGLISTGARLDISPDLLDLLKSHTTINSAIKYLETRGFSRATDNIIIKQTMKALYEVRAGVLYGDWNACSKFDIQSRVHQISAPTWIAVGTDDRLTPVVYSRFLADQIANTKLQIVPDAGHMVILEKPLEIFKGFSEHINAIKQSIQQK